MRTDYSLINSAEEHGQVHARDETTGSGFSPWQAHASSLLVTLRDIVGGRQALCHGFDAELKCSFSTHSFIFFLLLFVGLGF